MAFECEKVTLQGYVVTLWHNVSIVVPSELLVLVYGCLHVEKFWLYNKKHIQGEMVAFHDQGNYSTWESYWM